MWITKVICLTVAFYYLSKNILFSAIMGFLIGTLESILGEMWDITKKTNLIQAVKYTVERNK